MDAIFRIDAIRAKSQQLSSVEGSAKSLTDFQDFVSSLRTGGFKFAEPSVTQMKDGFSLRLERLTYRSKDSDQSKSPFKEAKHFNMCSVRHFAVSVFAKCGGPIAIRPGK